MDDPARYDRLDRIIEILAEMRSVGAQDTETAKKILGVVQDNQDMIASDAYQSNVTFTAIKGIAESLARVADAAERIDKRTEKYLLYAVVALIVAVGGGSVLNLALPIVKAALGLGP